MAAVLLFRNTNMAALTSCESALFPMAYPEGGFGGSRRPPPPPPFLTDLTLVWGWNSYIDRIVYHFLTGWFFLIKRALQFWTKLNSRDIQKSNCSWVPSYDLFASARKAVFSAPTATGVHRLRNAWSSLLSQLVTKKQNSPFCTKIWTSPSPPPTKNSWIRPWFHRRNSVKVSFWIKAIYY